MVRHFLTLDDFSSEEILKMVSIAEKVKSGSEKSRVLKDKNIAAIFEKPSTRTRVSFEVAVNQLGGNFVFLRSDELQLSRGEPVKDTARVLGRYVDGIVARVFEHNDLVELAKYSGTPVINALSNLYHPCQILADFLTIKEKKKKLKGLKLAYVGDGNNVCNSLLVGCTKIGLNISIGSPKRYEPNSEIVEEAKNNAKKSGSELKIVNSAKEAVQNADIVYTDVFVSMGDEKEMAERLKTFLPNFQVNTRLLENASPDAIVMHCLPAHRGQEITEDVLEGKQSVVWDQAENRLHAQKAIFIHLFYKSI
ncbi:MAG: ornithine carbamoyltransferase [Candidatus Jordarchaeum sp.]|uniref:ornithine carbamoyltransferase n=1 Tax=Candidatus Jordarchaeum sp. TaxID=2823881 RepID=UPI00404A2235